MKKTIITAAILLVSLASFSQATQQPKDTAVYFITGTGEDFKALEAVLRKSSFSYETVDMFMAWIRNRQKVAPPTEKKDTTKK